MGLSLYKGVCIKCLIHARFIDGFCRFNIENVKPFFDVESEDVHVFFSFDFLKDGFRYLLTPIIMPASIAKGSFMLPS